MPDRDLQLELLDPSDRQRLLAATADADPALLDRLRRLRDTVKTPITPFPHDAATPSPGIDTRLDGYESTAVVIARRYRLVRKVGEGGMGAVWLAEQTEPVKRRVAVKLIRRGRDPFGTVLTRFELERQAIALMDHPNIAKLFDAGEIPASGAEDEPQPYFVMEFVDGQPLNEFCDAHKLSVLDRLKLFVQICQAIHHAHQKGIIHRDLKPSNILIESKDGQPVAKVIDFGLAKAVGAIKLTNESIRTAYGMLAGTPQYMAPEQTNFETFDIDIRADIYALGVILFELLTGSTPIERETLARIGLEEILQKIRDEEAPAPSSRVTSSSANADIAANRLTDPSRLGRLLKGELDWIVMKGLAKERERRYESAAELARDIERYLHHEPVLVGPPSVTYRLRKFARRNRPQVIAATLVLLALVAGIVGTSIGLVRAKAARDREAARANAEEMQRKRAEMAEITATENATRADSEKRVAIAVQNFLQSKLLMQADTGFQADTLRRSGRSTSEIVRNPTIRELLHRAAAELAPDKIEANFPGEPDVQAALLATVGNAYSGIGDTKLAITHLERAAEMHKDRLGSADPTTLSSLNNLAVVLVEADRAEDAIKILMEVRTAAESRLGSDHDDTLRAMRNLAEAYASLRRQDKAIPLLEDVRKAQEAKNGPDHPDTLVTVHDLASIYMAMRAHAKAAPLLKHVKTIREHRLGGEHPDTLSAANDLAWAYQEMRRLPEAIRMYEQVRKCLLEKYDEDHPLSPMVHSNLGWAYCLAGRNEESIAVLERARTLVERQSGPDHQHTMATLNNLASAYSRAGRLSEAIPLLERVRATLLRKFGSDHHGTLASTENLAVVYLRDGQYGRAIDLFQQVKKALATILPKDHPTIVQITDWLALAYLQVGRNADALPLIEAVVDARRKQFPPEHPQLAFVLTGIADDLLGAGEFELAERYIREALGILRKSVPNAWGTFNAESMLGGALMGQKKHAEAEPLLRSGYEGLKRREATIEPPGWPRYIEATARLAAFCDATGKPDEAKKWRALVPPERGPQPRCVPQLDSQQ